MSQTKAQLIGDLTQALEFITTASTPANGLYLKATNQISLATNSLDRITIDSSGRVGIKTSSPGSYEVDADDLVVANTGGNAGLTIHSASNGVGSIYFADGTTGNEGIRGRIEYNQSVDSISFGTAAAGSKLLVDNVGNVGIGTVEPGFKLEIVDTIEADANNAYSLVVRGDDGGTNGESAQIFLGAINASTRGVVIASERMSTSNNHDMLFKVSAASAAPTERMRIDSSGRLLVGTSSTSANCTAHLQGSSSAGHAILRLASDAATPSSSDDLGIITFSAQDTDGAMMRVRADGNWSGSSQPTRIEYYTAASGSTSPTERMRISQDGTIQMLQNGGALLINTNTTLSAHKVGIAGNSQSVLYCDRKGNDGNLLTFFRDASEVGVISVASGTVSYGGGHISRWSQLPNNAERTEILMGSVLSNLDEMCEWAYDAEPEVLWEEGEELPEGVQVGDVKNPARPAGTEDNIQLNRMKVSDVEGDPNVAGVFQNWDNDDDTYTNDFFCAMTGDFVIRIAEGVTVERGDLLMSAGDGTAKPQEDDIVRSKTIAKVTSTNVSCTYDDGSYCVPCVLMAC